MEAKKHVESTTSCSLNCMNCACACEHPGQAWGIKWQRVLHAHATGRARQGPPLLTTEIRPTPGAQHIKMEEPSSDAIMWQKV